MPKASTWHGLLLILSFLLSPGLHAVNSQKHIDHLLQQATDEKLFLHPHWLNLGHYRPAYFPFHFLLSGYESYVDDNNFFLADDGKTNPRAEMEATIRAFFDPAAKAKDDQPVLCRYQARYQWLEEQLNLDIDFSFDKECGKFNQWYKAINPGQVSLIFPSSYMNSSSSMFGHTLLRIDPPPDIERIDLISFAVNFGAVLDVNRFDPFFAYRGLAGGYPGHFAVMPYHKKVKEYSKMENRDIWEYQLNFTEEEVRRMILHLWEIGDSNFDYYFIDENCSFRLLSLMDVARFDLNSAEEFVFSTVPVDTIRVLEGKGLVESVKYRPSKATIMQTYLKALNSEEKGMVMHLVDQPELLNNKPINALPDERKSVLLNAAYQYLRYTQAKKERSQKAADNSLKLLSALNRLPDEHKLVPVEKPGRAEKGHKVNLAAVASGYIDDEAYAEFRFRNSYHDLLDNDYGYLRGTEISFLDASFWWQKEQGLELERLDVIKIAAYTPRTAFIKLPSWRVYTGIEQVRSMKEEHKVPYIDGGRGFSYRLHENNITYAMLAGRLEYNEVYNSNWAPAAGLEAGQLWYFPWGVMQLDVSALEMLNADDYRLRLGIKQNIVVTTNSALRLELDRFKNHDQQYTVSSLAFRHYY